MNKLSFFKDIQLHEGAIYSLAPSLHESVFYSGSFDRKIVAWDTDNWEHASLIAELPSKALAMTFYKEENYLFIGTFAGAIHVLDLNHKKEIALLQKHSKMIFEILIHEGHLWVLGGDGILTIWELQTWVLKAEINFKEGKLRSLVFDDYKAYLGTQSGKILVLHKETLKFEQEWIGHEVNFSVNTLMLLPDKNQLVSGSRDGHLVLWDIKDGSILKRVPAHYMAIYDLTLDLSGGYFASCSMDKSIKIWDLNLNFVQKLERTGKAGHTNSVNKLLWKKEGLFSTGDDKKIVWWK